MVELVDVLPTLLDLLGLSPAGDFHGRSLVPLIRGDRGAAGRDVVFSEYLENEEAMARSERFKLVVGTGRRKRLDGYETGRPLSGPYERLYDLRDDPGETTDLSSRPEFAGIKGALIRELYHRLVSTQGRGRTVPADLPMMEAIHRCLVPPDAGPAR